MSLEINTGEEEDLYIVLLVDREKSHTLDLMTLEVSLDSPV